MFGKYVVFTVLTTVIFSLYFQQFHPQTFNDSSLKVIEFQNKLINWVEAFFETHGSSEETLPKINLLNVDELQNYNGEEGSKGLYLAILGKVYDVGAGKKHYGPGKSYHFFTGRDGSRAFVTGDFTEEGLTDDVLGLSPKEVKSILEWGEFYEKDYKYVGKLVGRYYDSNGHETSYHKEVEALLEEASKEEEAEKKTKMLFPPCNSEWSGETGGRVWCSKLSGGIERDWAGVPRQFYEPGSESYRCACLNVGQHEQAGINLSHVKEYPACDPTADSCQISSEEENEEREE